MKIILFDFDGVIADTFAFCYNIANSRDALTHDEYRARFEGNINETSKKVSQSTSRTAPFDFFAHYTPELMKCPPNGDVVKVIQELARNYPLIIISSTITPSIVSFLEMHGLKDAFKEILGNDIEKSKVKKIQGVIQKYGIKPSETVFITDTLGDIKEAKECGVRSIAVTWGFHPIETLEKGEPHKIISRPEEIIEAVKSMEQPF
jgi:phosphoglycolate phosphatase